MFPALAVVFYTELPLLKSARMAGLGCKPLPLGEDHKSSSDVLVPRAKRRELLWPCGMVPGLLGGRVAVLSVKPSPGPRRCDPTRGASVGVFGINQGLTCSSGLG